MADTLRVLYVDDEPTLLEMAKLFLEMRGVFAVDTLTSAGMALDRLNKEQYDAIISDYQMPDIDGIEFLKRVRASGNTIPFILFTGRGREEVVIQALNEGADFYLQKGGEPVSQFTELSHQIQQVVHHRRVDDSLRESEGRFEAFMDRLPVTAFIKDEKFTNLFVNRRMEEMFGAKEWIGKSVYDLFPGDAAEKMIEDDRQTLRDGYRTSVENLVGINGDKKIFETYKFRIDRENKPPLIGGFAIDITEQQLEKQAMYENEQRLTSIFNTVGDVIFQLSVGPDEQYHFTSVNSAFSRTTGLPPGQVIGRTVKEIIPEPSLTIVLEKYRQAIEKKTIIHWEEISSYPTGQLIGEVSVAPIFDEAGKCTHLIGSVHDITERKRSEDALRESEGKFRSLAESSPDYIMRYDRQGRHTYINPAALRASGLTEEQIIGKTHHESGFDETQNQFPEEKIIRVFETGKPYQGQFTRESVKGRIILDLMLTPEFADDGTVRSVFGVSRDITQLKLAEEELLKKNEELNASYEEIASSEEELRANLNILTEQEVALKESEAKFQSLYMHMIEGAALHELTYNDQGVPDDYIIIETNPAFEIHLGISRDNVIGKTSRVAYGVNEPPYLDIYAGVALTGEPQVFETYFPPLNKHFSISAYCPRKGRFATIFEDITERKRADEALEKSRIQLTEAMDLAHLVNWEYDVATGIFTFDDRFYALYGTTAEREGGYQMPEDVYAREFVHPDDQHMVADEVKKAIQAVDPEYVSEVEHRIIRRDGETRHIVVRFGITKDENGRTIKTHGANQDITELKSAEESLKTANKKLSLLSNLTRHDINNQLLALNGFLELLHRKVPDPALEDYFTRITKASGRISSMIEFTREYEKIGVNAPAWQDGHTLIGTAATETPLGQVIVKNDLPIGVEVFADPLIIEVFYNLMDNAIRYGEKITTLRFSVEKRNNELIIVCEDDGTGIPDEEKEKIFERGFGKNTGMGLFLAREILAITGITIRETGEPGKGARFEMDVPKGMFRYS